MANSELRNGNGEKRDGEAHTVTSQNSSSDEPQKPRIDWADPNVPVGNAPPLPRWPLVIAGIAWLAWVAFLVVMMLSRGQAPTI